MNRPVRNKGTSTSFSDKVDISFSLLHVDLHAAAIR
jgi:hypothetical protein